VNTLGKTLQISDSENLNVETDIAKAISTVFARVKKTAGTDGIAVGISGSNALNSEQVKNAVSAFKKLGYENILLM
ncbi:MAG: hypothetical protein IKT78_01575, partial [Ruminiclostridium sp.]|nr:hypothetical protein [Ruminiclostridium sp.]